MMTKDKLRKLNGDERLGQERESEYLGAEDIDVGAEPVLTIEGLYNGMVTLQRGKEKKDVLAFVEERVPGIRQVRPLIVNSTNRKTLRKLYGDAKASTLVGKRIKLYVDNHVRDPQDGGVTDGIRIRNIKNPAPQSVQQAPICERCGAALAPAFKMTPAQLAEYSRQHCSAVLCKECMLAFKEAQKAGEETEERIAASPAAPRNDSEDSAELGGRAMLAPTEENEEQEGLNDGAE